MRFHPQLEPAFQRSRNLVLARSDVGVAALSCCLWLTQLFSYALSGQSRPCGKAGLLLALNCIPLFQGHNWLVCRSRPRCLTLIKATLFILLCWDVSPKEAHGHGQGLAAGSPRQLLQRARSLPARLGSLQGANHVPYPPAHQPKLQHLDQQRQQPEAVDPPEKQQGVPPELPASAVPAIEADTPATVPNCPADRAASLLGMLPADVEACHLAGSGSTDTARSPATAGEAGGGGGCGGGDSPQSSSTAGCASADSAAGDTAGSLNLPSFVSETKLFALLHAGLAFRYTRWQHTAAVQTVLLGVAAAHAAWRHPCSHGTLAAPSSRRAANQAACFLTNLHWLVVHPDDSGQNATAPMAMPATLKALPSDSSCSDFGGSWLGVGGRNVAAALPQQLEPCRLLVTWMQVCMGWVLPIWAAVLSETDARSTFAAQNTAHLLPEEREWALAAAVGSEWAAMLYQFPMLCLTAWHLLLAATAAAARVSHASRSGGMG